MRSIQPAERRFPALASRPFRFILGSFAVSTFGDWLYNIVLLAWIYERTGSGSWVAAASVARILPVILFSIVAGDLVDRFDRRKVMIVSDIARAATMFGLAVVASLSGSPFLAVVLVFVSASLGTAFLPAVDSMLPSLVDPAQLPSANAGVTIVQYLSLAAGPAVGGLLALLGSSELVFGINAITFLISALLIAALPSSRAEHEGTIESPVRRVKEGVRAIRSSVRITALVVCLPLTSFIPGAAYVLLVLLADRRLGLDPEGATFLYAAIGVGAIVTSWFSDRLTTAGPPWVALIITNSVMGLSFAILGLAEHLPIAYLFCAAIGASTLVGDVIAFTLLQKAVPDRFLGRVFGVVNALLYLGMAAGSVVAPFLEQWLGLGTAFAIIGICTAASIAGLSLLLRGWDMTVGAGPRVEEYVG